MRPPARRTIGLALLIAIFVLAVVVARDDVFMGLLPPPDLSF